ncbi:MAG: tetratricopeptide repeat protein, partial [Candidatus Aminicenantaceae bacterium]
VRGEPSGIPWRDKLYDLRIEDHPNPVRELKRLLKLNKAYNHMNQGDEYLAENRIEEAMQAYTRAMEMVPGNAEMIFWPAVTLAATGRVEKSLPLFRQVFAMDQNWAVLLPRLAEAGQFPKDQDLIRKILDQAPKKNN